MKIILNGNEKVEWTDEMDSLIGTKPNDVIAKELGLWALHVELRRLELGAPPYRHPPIQWTKEMDALLGTDSDPKVAEKLGITHPNAVFYIGKRRRDLGIEAFTKRSVVRPWTPEEDAILGTKPNCVVAEELSRSSYQVSKRMKELNIPKLSQRDPEVEKRRQAEYKEKVEKYAKLNAIAHNKDMSEGLAVWSLIWRGYSVVKAAEYLEISRWRADKLFHCFRRLLRHPKRLGRDIMKDEPLNLIEEIRRRTEYEISHNDSSILAVWSEPWPEIHEDKSSDTDLKI